LKSAAPAAGSDFWDRPRPGGPRARIARSPRPAASPPARASAAGRRRIGRAAGAGDRVGRRPPQRCASWSRITAFGSPDVTPRPPW